MASQRLRWLVGAAVLLAVVRLVFVPWSQAQSEQRERVEVLTQQLDRSLGVMHNRREILDAQKGLERTLALVRSRYPEVSDPGAYRLQVQRQMGDLAQGSGTQVSLFEWLLDGRVPDAALSYGRIRLKLEGRLRDVIRTHGEIEGSLPNVAVREVKLDLGTGAAAPADVPASAELVIDVYYRTKKSQASLKSSGT